MIKRVIYENYFAHKAGLARKKPVSSLHRDHDYVDWYLKAISFSFRCDAFR